MRRLSRASLGFKLNLALVSFFLMLGGLTTVLILYGFNRTQDNASSSSQEGLEDFGSKTLGSFARLVAGEVGLSFARASQSGEIGAQYLLDADNSVPATWDASVLVANGDGVLYDPTENRLADSWIPNILDSKVAAKARLEKASRLGPLFPGLLASVPDAIAVYFVGADGALTYYPPIGVQDYLDPDAYIWEAAEFDSVLPDKNPERKTVWVPPYDDLAQQGQLVSVLSPVYFGDEFFGVVGFDLILDAFVGEVNDINPTANGFSFYIDKAGKLLPTLHSESVESSAAEPDNESLLGALEAMRNGEAGQVRTRIGGSDVYVAFAPIEGLGGSLALVGPVEDVLAEAQAGAVAAAIQDEGDRTLRLTLLTMGALFIVGLIAASYLNRRVLIRPIQALAAGTRAVGQGDFSTRIDVAGNDELAELARSFNAMSDEVVAARGGLERQVEERTRELSTLLRVSNDVASTLELRPLLSVVLEQVQHIADYERCSILTLEGDRFVILDSRSSHGQSPVNVSIPVGREGPILSHIFNHEAVIVNDMQGDSPAAVAYRESIGDLRESTFRDVRAWMGVPLALKDRIIGILTLAHNRPGFYTEHQAGLVSAVATQIAVAIENARLYEQAQHLAAVEERQRLARELHDSVSQALYGIALGARTARTLLDTDPPRATEPVDYVLQLADAGLAEMRALIFELRPESLEAEGLVAAIEKQVAAIRARYGLEVTADLCDEPDITLGEKEVFYRVAQESLHNIVKHARATRVDLGLNDDDGALTLQVRDNGVGFDASQSFPGHMGLVSFNERAASIGAELSVDSAPGSGTTVRLSFVPKESSTSSRES